MNKKEETKSLLKGHNCDKCFHRKMSNEEIEKYVKMWKSFPPEDWCNYLKNRPKENFCKNFNKEDVYIDYYEDMLFGGI